MSNSLLDEGSGPPQPSIEDAFAKAADKRKRITYLAIPITLGVGLLVAMVYIGGRIGSAKPRVAAPAVASAPITVPPPPAPAETAKSEPPKPSPFVAADPKPDASKGPAVPAKVPETKTPEVKNTVAKATPAALPTVPVPVPSKPAVHSDAPLTLITPRPGETYLQLAALVPHTVLRYLDELRAEDLAPCVAPGPTPDLLRVLVGPFPDKESLAKAKAKLDAEKMIWIVRSY